MRKTATLKTSASSFKTVENDQIFNPKLTIKIWLESEKLLNFATVFDTNNQPRQNKIRTLIKLKKTPRFILDFQTNLSLKNKKTKSCKNKFGSFKKTSELCNRKINGINEFSKTNLQVLKKIKQKKLENKFGK